MTDQTDGRPLVGVTASITVSDSGKTRTEKTQEDGTVNLGTLPRDTVVKVKLEKESYQDKTRNLTPDCSGPVVIALKPIAIARITLTWQKGDMDLRLLINQTDCRVIDYENKVCGKNSLDQDSKVNMH